MHIAESSHFYDKLGNPVYEVPNKSKPGEMRPTSLRDARRLDLVPSVTTILSILAKPQLERWKQEQVLLASLTLPRPEGMSEQDWISAILDDAKRQSIEAADLGTKVHAAIQGMYNGILWEPEYADYCEAVYSKMLKEFGNRKWIAEKSFAHILGFGGKVDLISEDWLIMPDFKTTSLNGKELEKAGYPEHLMQLAAYRLGMGMKKATLANTYISTTNKGEVFIKIYTEEEAIHATNKWLKLLEFWKLDKKFNLTIEGE